MRAWPVDHGGDQVTMSRGFHAFFRQYYNLRALLRRVDPALERLVAARPTIRWCWPAGTPTPSPGSRVRRR